MDAAQVLRDLTEISSQIEAAVLVAADGSVLAATLADETSAGRLATAAQALAGAAVVAPHASGEELVQLEVSTADGNVFVVRDRERMVAAVTSADPTAGLVFYDLKSCLRAAAAEHGDGKPRPRARRARSTAAIEGASGESSS